LSFPQGGLSADLRAELVDAVRDSDYLAVSIDEVVLSNRGIGGAPAFSADFVVNVTEAVIGGVLTAGLIGAVKRVFKVLAGTFPERMLRIKIGSRPSAYYRISGDIEMDKAFESIPEDYERSVTTETTFRRWSNGRWEIMETRRETGGPMNRSSETGEK